MVPRVVHAALDLIEDVTLRERVLEVLCAEHPETLDLVREMFREPADAPDPIGVPAPGLLGQESELIARERFLRRLLETGDPGPIGAYRVLDQIGQGGMGTVFRAIRDDATESAEPPVLAIKILTECTVIAPEARRRWDREIAIIGALRHPNVIFCLDSGVIHGTPWVAMPYCNAGNLAERFRRFAPLSVSRAVRLADRILAGMAYVHERGVVHRDLKPANVLLQSADGIHVQAKVADFGLARGGDDELSSLTRPGAIAGSFASMAPEQIENFHAATPRSDVWSLGAIVYESLAARPPRPLTAGADFARTYEEVRHGRAVPIGQVREGLPPALAAWLDTSLSHDAGKRFADAGAMRRALRAVVAETGLLR